MFASTGQGITAALLGRNPETAVDGDAGAAAHDNAIEEGNVRPA
jgi:hypothetical protein